MNSDIERVEQYLQGIRAPDPVSDAHRQHLRQRILGAVEERRITARRRRRWETVVALAALVCIVGTVGAFTVVKYRAAGQRPAGASRLAGENPEPAPPPGTPDQKDDAELAQVIESEVNGRLASRMLIPERTVSDSQMKALSEGDLNIRVQSVLVALPAAARTETVQLRQAGKGENLGTQERQMKGRVFLFKRERYTLHDGTKVTLSVGEPKNTRQPLPPIPEGNQP